MATLIDKYKKPTDPYAANYNAVQNKTMENIRTQVSDRDAKDSQRIRNQAAANAGNYDFSAYAGNTNGYYNGMKNAGFTWNGNKGSNFSYGSDPSLQPYAPSVDDFRAMYGGGGSVSAASLSHIGQFAPSQAYLDAMAYTQGLLDKINTGRTSYSDKVDAMMDKIANRPSFEYDFNTDPLFQNALASAMSSGQTAMQDTIGQASALTGGYGSSYATSAGNQQYNNFVKGAYDQLPEFYNIALDAYTREGDEMYRQLGMYNTADDKEFGRLTTAYGLNYQQAQDMYGHEYNNYWDTANYNLNVDKYNADAAMEASKFNASQSLANAKFKYEQYQDALARQDALNAASSSSSASSSHASSSEINAMKSDLKAMAEKGGADNPAIEQYILRQWNAGKIDENDIQDFYSYIDAVTPNAQPSLKNQNGSYAYTDQYGASYETEPMFIKSKTATQSANDEYTDQYGNTYTRSELEAMYGSKKWKDYVK